MNIGMIKIWAWAAAGLLTLGLSWYVLDFVTHLETKRQPPDQKVVKEALDSVKPMPVKSDDLVSYTEAKRLIADLNWTGKVRAVEAPPVAVEQVKGPQHTPVKKLVRVVYVAQDIGDPTGSRVFLRYKPEAGVANNGLAGGYILKEGDHLAAPHDKIVVASITTEGIWFSFEGTDREKELLGPDDFDPKTAIVQVGPDGVRMPKIRSLIPRTERDEFRPGRTTPMGLNTYKLGTEDVQYISENYSEILTRDVETRQHRDPKTGKYDGIEIKSVQPGSIAARHGAQEGDVVKSINGHPVNSTQEAITFAKTNANNYTTWEILVENRGKTRTVTYQSPNH